MREFLLDRIRLVRELLDSDIEVDHSDIGLILYSVLSACAAERWPGRKIDLDLPSCHAAYPAVSVCDLKGCSFAALIYEWLRCGYAHQCAPHVNITHYPPSRHNARVSYIGRGTSDGGLTRVVSFHRDYLIALTEHHAASVAPSPQSPPAEWWINAAERRLTKRGRRAESPSTVVQRTVALVEYPIVQSVFLRHGR
jgi:hypothetical protein